MPRQDQNIVARTRKPVPDDGSLDWAQAIFYQRATRYKKFVDNKQPVQYEPPVNMHEFPAEGAILVGDRVAVKMFKSLSGKTTIRILAPQDQKVRILTEKELPTCHQGQRAV